LEFSSSRYTLFRAGLEYLPAEIPMHGLKERTDKTDCAMALVGLKKVY